MRLVYLAPAFSTLLNALVAYWILQHSNKSCALAQSDILEVPAQQEATARRICLDGPCEPSNKSSPSHVVSYPPPVPAEQDKNLKWMPDFDFHAYVRRDVSTFYNEEPGSRQETVPAFQGQAGKFINMSPERLDLYWDSGKGFPGVLISQIGPFESGGTATFPGHRFYFARKNEASRPVCRFFVTPKTSIYFYDPFSYDFMHDDGACRHNNYRSLASESEKKQYDAQHRNLAFGKAYKEFTGGSEWLSMYPREPPQHPIWATEYIRQQHVVFSEETHFEMVPSQTMRQLSWDDLENHNSISLPQHRKREADDKLELDLTVLSCEPKALEIRNFLSDAEADHLIDLALAHQLHLSTTGKDHNDGKVMLDSRSSYNTWISRYSSPVVDAIYRRAAHVLDLDESLLRHRPQNSTDRRANDLPLSEDLQLVHYEDGQQYTAHHDFSFPDSKTPPGRSPPTRSINILMYLNEGMEGGETSFPRWRNGETSSGLDVRPEKGKAIIFYMVNPDGNLDDLSQHAALPVTKGEKWLANLWIWDPFRM